MEFTEAERIVMRSAIRHEINRLARLCSDGRLGHWPSPPKGHWTEEIAGDMGTAYGILEKLKEKPNG